MIVVDTNVLAYLYFPSDHVKAIEEVLSQDNEWVAPMLWKSEFLNVASLHLRKRMVSYDDIVLAFEEANEFVITLEINHDHKAIISLVSSSTCSSYDCEFVCLAKKLSTYLITYDKVILREFPEIALKPEDYLNQIK